VGGFFLVKQEGWESEEGGIGIESGGALSGHSLIQRVRRDFCIWWGGDESMSPLGGGDLNRIEEREESI